MKEKPCSQLFICSAAFGSASQHQFAALSNTARPTSVLKALR